MNYYIGPETAGVVEPCFNPEIFITGIEGIQIAGDVVRFAFVALRQIDPGRCEMEKVVLGRFVVPTGNFRQVAASMMRSLALRAGADH